MLGALVKFSGVFRGVEKGWIGNKCVNTFKISSLSTWSHFAANMIKKVIILKTMTENYQKSNNSTSLYLVSNIFLWREMLVHIESIWYAKHEQAQVEYIFYVLGSEKSPSNFCISIQSIFASRVSYVSTNFYGIPIFCM